MTDQLTGVGDTMKTYKKFSSIGVLFAPSFVTQEEWGLLRSDIKTRKVCGGGDQKLNIWSRNGRKS